ncbi:PVC-type heme-binding CxxCH protein [Algoriphagus antarcticus]|uniref:Putative membrane-bound dehydrogenase-like protein n=1 Tax=Algoriphagus antarcticus TaxID=238540 RepID=A0A3E0DXS4_9BACT|nr:PVC-type heme-binding CxxCH protein [Algoriphagus antarcticus]REG88680.1 putative membrane-bound dehydrogenase-like protein [Algoriphagus antarcticus]
MKLKIITSLLAISSCFYLYNDVYAQKITHSPRSEVKTPEQQLKGFKLPEGFIVELVASERDGIVNPIDLTFDDAGRLWTQTAEMYPLDPIADIQWNDLLKLMNDPEAQRNHPNFKRISDLYQGITKGTDKILILSNLYSQTPLKVSIWADGLTIPQSILPYKNGAFVAQGSELFFLQDTNHDGKADKRVPLFTGFGFTDTHTMSHTLIRAPGNWIHFSHGALNKGEVSALSSDFKVRMDYSKIARFLPDGKKMEIVSSGQNNIWGFQLRRNGEWYGSEANDLGYSVAPMESGTGFPGIGSDRIRNYQPWMPALHQFRVGGTGISGLAFADDTSGSFPEEWKNVAFLANPITSTINSVRIVRNPDGSVTAEHLEDLLVSEDDWFRPVNMEFGPDGCLYIADWYNKIISHNELPTTHPDRDKTHGRIWRIRHISQQPREIPDFYKVKTENLVDYLSSPSLWAKRAAWQQISDRPISETKKLSKKLIELASDQWKDDITRIHALWSLEGIRHYDEKLMSSLLLDPSDDLRRESIRAMASFNLEPAYLSHKLKVLIEDDNPMVRSQVIRTLTEMKGTDPGTIEVLLQASKPELPGNEMGGPYERRFERFLARKSLEQYPDDLQNYLNSPAADQIPVENLLWAIQALGREQKEHFFLKLWPKAGITELDESNFISISQMLDNREVYHMVKPVFHNPVHSAKYIRFALQNQALVQSDLLTAILETPVANLFEEISGPDVDMALDAVGRFNMKNSRLAILALIREDLPEKTMGLIVTALEADVHANQDVFNMIFQNAEFAFSIRSVALHNISKANLPAGREELGEWIPQLDDFQKTAIVKLFSGSKNGADILKQLYAQDHLDITAFDLSTAETILNHETSDSRGNEIYKKILEIEEKERNSLDGRIAELRPIIENNDGNVVKGKAMFQTCLMCHKVGNQGQNFAPALDGSASRDTEALLTAILDPDAAVESNYATFRVTKKDGGNIEGFLVKRDEGGTTIGFMGGSQLFIQAKEIRSQGFLGGRSFMMKGLIDHYTKDQVADLFAYINTLN